MKRMLLFCMILCPIIMYSQNVRTIKEDNVKKVFFKDINGKTSKFVYYSPSGNLNDFQVHEFSNTEDNDNNKIAPNKNDNIYSLSFKGQSVNPVDFSVLIANNGFYYNEADITWLNDSVCQIDFPEGEYEIMLSTMGFPQDSMTFYYVFFNNFMLQSDSVLDIDFELMAKNNIEVNMVDEAGNPFTPDADIIDETISIVFPENIAFGSMRQSLYRNRLPNIRFSDVNGDYHIFTSLNCVKDSDVFSTNSYLLNTVFSDTILSNQSEDYKSLKMIMKATPNAESMFITHGCAEISHSFLISAMSFPFNEDYPTHDNDTINLFLNNKIITISESNKATTCPLVFFWQKQDEGAIGPYHQYLYAPSPVVTDTDSITLVEFGAHIDYSNFLFESGDAISIGGTVPHIQSWGNNDNDTISLQSIFIGQHSENRSTDAFYSTYSIIHDDQVIASGNLVDFSGSFSPVDPEIYTWELTNPNYKVHQKPGKAILSGTFDLGNQDPNFPIITSFKIFNHNDAIGEDLLHHESASILFSTLDFVKDFWINEVPASVQAYYNIDGEEDWNELVVTSHHALYDPYKYGYFYSCDLTPVLAQFDNIGYINFKIDVIDDSGNICTQTWSPLAFVRHPLGIQTSVSLSTQSLTVSPNPVNRHCVIDFNLTETAQSELMVLDINGKLVESILSSKLDAGNHQISWSPSPSLTKGTYLIKLVTAKGIKTSKVFIQ